MKGVLHLLLMGVDLIICCCSFLGQPTYWPFFSISFCTGSLGGAGEGGAECLGAEEGELGGVGEDEGGDGGGEEKGGAEQDDDRDDGGWDRGPGNNARGNLKEISRRSGTLQSSGGAVGRNF